MIYDYLLYHSYLIALKTSANRDTPMFFSIPVIGLCFIFNISSLLFLCEGLLNTEFGFFSAISEFRYVYGIVFTAIIFGYYSLNKRYDKIIEKFKAKDKENDIKHGTFKSIIILLAHYVISFLLLLITGMFRNGDGIFA